MIHRPFEMHFKCDKCGVGAQNAHELREDATGEYLAYKCWACGFRWTSVTKDSPKMIVTIAAVPALKLLPEAVTETPPITLPPRRSLLDYLRRLLQ